MAIGDALAAVWMERRGISPADFAINHPAGSLGKQLTMTVADLMVPAQQLPALRPETPLPDVISQLTQGAIGSGWVEAYQAIDITTAPFRNRGDTVNLIYSNQSWFSAKRHLGRLKYDRLIEFNPKNNSFLIEEGIQKGKEYTPQTGDFLYSIDAEIKSPQHSIEPENLELLHQNTNETGKIYRIE